MTGDRAAISDELRAEIMARPEAVLEDGDVMSALAAATEKARGGNVVDIRGVAMERLETRHERLEETHRHALAAAYGNLAGAKQVHRAVLRLLDAEEFEGFLTALGGDVLDIMRVDATRLVLESALQTEDPAIGRVGDLAMVAKPGFVDAYLGGSGTRPARQVTLRSAPKDSGEIYGSVAGSIRSEACMKLDLGPGRLPGMLAFGAKDPNQFRPELGTDLLAFFFGVFERSMRRWLS